MGPCLSMIPGAPQLPAAPEFPAADVAAKTAEAVVGLVEAAKTEEDRIRSEWGTAKSNSQDYKVVLGAKKTQDVIPQTYDETKDKLTLFGKYGLLLAASGAFADKCADQVWQVIKPQLDAQKPDPMPAFPGLDADAVWDKVLSPLKAKVTATVRQAVQKAADDAIAKAMAS